MYDIRHVTREYNNIGNKLKLLKKLERKYICCPNCGLHFKKNRKYRDSKDRSKFVCPYCGQLI